MEVITIESEAFIKLQQMYVESQKALLDMAKKPKINTEVWLDIKQVSEMTRYHKNTILARKDEIGYRTIGRDLHFKLSAVEKWMEKYYRGPRN